MKRIINGKKYDTVTANKIFETGNSIPGDSHRNAETLYLKKSGEYFLVLEDGDPSERLTELGYRNLNYIEEIIPYTAENAKDWLATQAEDSDEAVDLYEEIFGAVEE